MSQLEIRVLGELAVLRDGAAAELPPSKKTRALLAFLAVSDRPQRRERLCEMFWEIPDDPRGALRWSLSKLRQIVNAPDAERLEADRNTVFMRKDGIALDFAALARLAKADLAACELGELEQAAASFRGLFLDDLALPRCPEFEAWRVSHANELELLRLKLLRQLIDRLRDEPERALPYAHALQALVPEDSALAAEAGEIAEAARQRAVVAAPVPAKAAVPAAEAVGAEAPPPAEPAMAGEAPPADILVPTAFAGAARAAEPPPFAAPVAVQEIRFCTTRDGVRLAYAVSGSGPPIVRAAHWMSHLQFDWESPVFRHWIDGLSEGHTLIRYDERGNGLSDWEVDDLSFEAMVADLESIVDAAGLERFALLGLSQGCGVSVAYAVRHPERVSALILYGGYVQGWRRRADPAESAQREAMCTLARQGWGQDNPVFRQLFTNLFIPGADREQMDWFNELQRRTVSPENAYRLLQAFADIDVSDLLPQVQAPTLVMHARLDGVAPFESGRAFATGIAGARFVELESPNHILLEQEPAFRQFLEQTRAFVRDTAGHIAVPLPEKEARKQVSVLAVELISPLQAFEAEDPEIAVSLLDPLMNAATDAVRRHGGDLVAVSDATLNAVFGARKATEDHALDACRAALDIKATTERRSQGQVRLRIALDTGPAVVRPGRGGFDGVEVIGPAVRVAGQLMRSLREPQIAVTSRMRDAAGGYFRFGRLSAADLLAFGRDQRLYEILGENRALSSWYLRVNQGLTRLIGRATEMSLMEEAWQRVREGQGQLIGVVGDPGIGKSRLTHEFLAAEALSGFTILEAGALRYERNVSLALVKKLLRSLFGIDDADEAGTALGKTKRRIDSLGADQRLLPPLVAALDLPVEDADWLAAPAAERAQMIRDSVRAALAAEARRRPVVVLLEDLHWIDAESEAVLARIVDGLAVHRMLVIASYRPVYEHHWMQRSYFHEIRLDRLSRSDSEEFLRALLGSDASLEGLIELLARRTDGTPLFMEEIVRGLAQSGRLSGAPGDYRAVETIAEFDLPSSVQSVIAARIDRLPDGDRQLLQVASVIGKEVPLELLQAVTVWPAEEVRAALLRLQEAEFLFETQSFPEVEYTFKHALTQEVAYASLLSDTRKRLHGAALSAMERALAGRLAEHAEKLAEHALHAELWDKAVGYLAQAAERAEDRSAHRASIAFLEAAADALERLPRTSENVVKAIQVRTSMRPAYDATGDYPKALARLDEARRLAEESGEEEALATVLLHHSYLKSTYGRLDEALADAERLKEIALARGLDRLACEADVAAAKVMLGRCQARAAAERLRPHHGKFIAEWRHDRFGQAFTRSVFYLGSLAVAEAFLGNFAEAWAEIDQARIVAQETRRSVDGLGVCYFSGIVSILHGPSVEALAELESAAEQCRDALLSFRPWFLTALGHAQFARGEFASACETLKEAIESAERLRMPQFRLYAFCILACACLAGGIEAGDADPDEALTAARDGGDSWLELIVLRTMGAAAAPETGAGLIGESIAIAERSGFPGEAARGKLALGRLLARSDTNEARRLIGEASQEMRRLAMDQEALAADQALAALAAASGVSDRSAPARRAARTRSARP